MDDGDRRSAGALGTKEKPVTAPLTLRLMSAVTCSHHGLLIGCTRSPRSSFLLGPRVRGGWAPRMRYRLASGFFFSSRRRHTRCGRDWSSDVCSSDLPKQQSTTGSFGYSWSKPCLCSLFPCNRRIGLLYQ